MRDRNRIIHPDASGHFAFMRTGGGHDAVHHGIGKCSFSVYPACKVGVDKPGQPDNALTQYLTVAQQIVTAKPGEGRHAITVPDTKRGHHGPKGGTGPVKVFRIMLNVGMGYIQPACFRIKEIAAFSDGQ